MTVRTRTRRSTSGELAAYLADIMAIPLLSVEEERALAQQVQAGDTEARERMVRSNLRLVIWIARQVHRGHRHLDLADRIGWGNLGLIQAVDRFDPAFGVRFNSYAKFWIKQAIRQAFLSSVLMIRVPVYLERILTREWLRDQGLDDRVDPAPKPVSPSRARGLAAAKWISQPGAFVTFANRDSWNDDGLGEIMLDSSLCPAEQAERAETFAALNATIEGLDPDLARVLQLRYGLDGQGQRSLRAVAGEIGGVSVTQVRQIEFRALRALRIAVKATWGE